MIQISRIKLFATAKSAHRNRPTLPLLTLVDADHTAPDIGMLLPEQNYNQTLLQALQKLPRYKRPRSSVAGLFLSDPFLHLPTALDLLKSLEIRSVANFPSTSFYGNAFAAQLDTVGFSREKEFRLLEQAWDQGFSVVGCVNQSMTNEIRNKVANWHFINRWLVHGGLEHTLTGSVPPREFAGSPAGLQGKTYLYTPGIANKNLPVSYAGYAVAEWW